MLFNLQKQVTTLLPMM